MDGWTTQKINASGTLRGRGIKVSSYSWELGKFSFTICTVYSFKPIEYGMVMVSHIRVTHNLHISQP